ncbi:hypothetical protein [Paraburkholderia sp. BL23I1N1]|uniref:hypothetical protein n=1 Tax=Paraburkholderia sp. BL23I1N1 TaxID=1938802 RepID=UPI00217D60CC|nr:hypothetical protein [Paraburkholderia sp. BL23I1N1]
MAIAWYACSRNSSGTEGSGCAMARAGELPGVDPVEARSVLVALWSGDGGASGVAV